MRTGRLAGRAATALLACTLVAALGCVGSSPAEAADGAQGSTIRVGVKPLDPFVAKTGSQTTAADNDRYSGFSIDLWNEIAARNTWHTVYVWHPTLPALLTDVQSSAVDVGIAGISITKDREQVIDFSYPMFNAGLEVMASARGGGGDWTSELRGFVTAGIGRYLLALVLVLVLAGHVIWLATRRRTGRGYLRGIGHGTFQAAGLGLSGDFGVGDPVTPVARFVAVVWVIVGICFVSLFTAAVTTQLTVASIQSNVTGVADLKGKHVLTVEGTSASRYLTLHKIGYTAVAAIDDEHAYTPLDEGRADAIVFDAPVLEHHLQSSGSSGEVIVGGIFQHEDYGIALPNGSPLRKLINATLLEMRADGTYDQIYARYFGQSGS
jgi:polar amino acid transport system substrate-binding protein